MTAFGALIFPTDYSIAPAPLAKAMEQRGFESLFVTEHTHIPASRKSPWPGGKELPKEYWHTLDPYVALSAAAAVTTSLKVGTGITLVTEHDPIALAKQVASLDHISGGRVLLGIGAGWNAEEMAHHGVEFKDRWKVTRERVLAMRRIWTEEAPEFHGEYVNFEPLWSWPKPVQPGGPKVLLGASSRFAFDRVAEYCDGWFPIHQDASRAAAAGSVDYADGIRTIREKWRARGRPGEPDFTIFGVPGDAKRVDELIAMGFNRIVFGLPPAEADKVLPLLDRYASIAHTRAG